MAYSRKDFLKLSGMGAFALAGQAVNACTKEAQLQKTVIKPNGISFDSTIGLVAPASPIYDPAQFDEMLVTLQELGFNLKLGKHVRDRRGYLAGTDEDRASDLMNMFKDDEVEAILCIRGGWGCNRILPYLDFEIIKSNPKPLIGFSDITSLHMSMFAKTGLVSFHGPVGKSEWNDFTKSSFKQVLVDGKPGMYQIPEEELYNAYTIRGGKAEGLILGGNLSVLVAMLGSSYVPSFDGAILFLEDVGEDPYRVDRMITQLKLAGILDSINGFIFGQCTNCDAGANSLTLQQVFDDHIKPLNIPAFYGAMISHESKNVTIPVGLASSIDADTLSFSINESAIA